MNPVNRLRTSGPRASPVGCSLPSCQGHALYAASLPNGLRNGRATRLAGSRLAAATMRYATTWLKDKDGFQAVIDGLRAPHGDTKVDVVLGIEARGFIFAAALAYAMNAGFVPVRKPKKLPAETVSVTYDLEYGADTLEMHRDAVGAVNVEISLGP